MMIMNDIYDKIFYCWRRGYRTSKIKEYVKDRSLSDKDISDLFKCVTERYWNGKRDSKEV